MLAAAGLTLLVGGVVTATRGHRWWGRSGASVGVLLLTATTVVVVSPAVAATNVPRPAIGPTPTSVGLDYEDVTLRTADGAALAAWYVASSNGAAVVLLHGAGSTRSDVLAQAEVIARAGYGVLLVDARGHGQSSGRAMDFGWDGDADIAAATEHLATRPDVDGDRLGVVGLSMGGEEALGATRSNRAIRAVVAEGATGRVAADDAWLSERFGARGLLQEQLEQLQDIVTDVLTSASVPTSCRAAVEASDASYLLISAGDVPDEERFAAHLSAGAPDRVQTWTVDGAGHTGGLRTAPAQWGAEVVGFLDRTLLGDDRTP